MVSPENTPIGNIIETEQVIARDMYGHIHLYTYMHMMTIKTDVTNLKESTERYTEGLKRGKERWGRKEERVVGYSLSTRLGQARVKVISLIQSHFGCVWLPRSWA